MSTDAHAMADTAHSAAGHAIACLSSRQAFEHRPEGVASGPALAGRYRAATESDASDGRDVLAAAAWRRQHRG
jgi:hypothetical protein